LPSYLKEMEKLPEGTMYDDDILRYAAKPKIPYFIGVRIKMS